MKLEIKDLSSGYGAVQVLRGVNLTVNDGEMVALVGANGAGKTTLLKTISGLVTARSGAIMLGDTALQKIAPVSRVRLGLAHVPEGRQVFSDLTVRENLELGAYTRLKNLTSEQFEERIKEVTAIFPALEEKMELPAGGLSGGQQQMLAIARGLMSKPALLLLDEPSLGLSPVLVSEIFRVLRSLRELGVAILLAEQNAKLSLAIADRGYVIETGRIVREGTGADLLASSDIMERYLGVGVSSINVDQHDRKEEELTRRLSAIL
jgi:branched-chain amino acid transport system ATP-binding protein